MSIVTHLPDPTTTPSPPLRKVAHEGEQDLHPAWRDLYLLIVIIVVVVRQRRGRGGSGNNGRRRRRNC